MVVIVVLMVSLSGFGANFDQFSSKHEHKMFQDTLNGQPMDSIGKLFTLNVACTPEARISMPFLFYI